MSLKYLVILLLLGMMGACFGQVRPETAKQLSQMAKAKHLHFVVQCSSIDLSGTWPDLKFIAWANIPAHNASLYIEEGGKPDWTTHAKTQQEAAEKLIMLLQGGPNTFPEHRPKLEKAEQCAKPLEGGGEQ
jgi:hypothetical protein